ncbi:aftiphilin, partial [Homo sapiens]
FPHFSEPGDDFGEFGDINAVSCQEETILTKSDLKQTSDNLSEECQLARKSSGTGTEPVAKLKNGQEGEIGHFDSVPNIQDDCNGFQDSDDFADFSSAGPSQVVDWNAFEDEQKDSCSWAAFGDQQATESHHRKEAWQSHRTDENIDTPGTPKTHSVPSATSKGAVASGHLQESATSVQGMLEPTKEPLKPLSAAEKIASIGQTATMSPDMNTCTSDQFQVWIRSCMS